MVQKIPVDFETITPSLNIENAAKAIELYKKAFDAKEEYCMKTPDGKVMHACLQIGTSKIFLADVFPNCGGPSNSSFYLYLEDVDAAHKKAKAAGLEDIMPPEDMFWGDRVGAVKDAFGISWSLATHVKDVSEEDMKKGQAEFVGKMANKSKAA